MLSVSGGGRVDLNSCQTLSDTLTYVIQYANTALPGTELEPIH